MIIDITMDKNTHYWLSRVAIKFNQLYLKGIDFNIYEHQWVFDWDKNLTTDMNLENCAAEDKALTLFTLEDAINSDHRKNFYRDQQLESLSDPLRGFGVWGGWDDFPPAKREYDYIRIVYGLNWGKFVEFCEKHSINYKDDKVPATLEIDYQTPIVRVGNKSYTLKPLHDGVPLDVIKQAILHPNTSITLPKLREWTGKDNRFNDKKNFKQLFSSSEFKQGNVLSPFAKIESKTFTLIIDNVGLTATQLVMIQKLSIN